jgi:hypothetical protein
LNLNRSETSDELADFVPEVIIDGESFIDKETQSQSTIKIRKLSEDNSYNSADVAPLKKVKKRKILDFHQF